jgi:hypothetical protein
MHEITLQLSDEEITSLGFAMAAGISLAMKRKDTVMRALLTNVHRKVLMTAKTPVKGDQ